MAIRRILGIDPGLTHTGVGVIDFDGFKSREVYHSVISPPSVLHISKRLAMIHQSISEIIETYKPDDASIEEVFVNNNPRSSLTLGLARGVALCVPAIFNIKITEYTPNVIKKTVVGNGHADKSQIAKMVQILLGNTEYVTKDSADALAIAICHAHHLGI